MSRIGRGDLDLDDMSGRSKTDKLAASATRRTHRGQRRQYVCNSKYPEEPRLKPDSYIIVTSTIRMINMCWLRNPNDKSE